MVFLRGPSLEMLVSYERLTLNGMPNSAFTQHHIDYPGRLQLPHGEIWLYTKIMTTETPPRAGASAVCLGAPGNSPGNLRQRIPQGDRPTNGWQGDLRQ